MQVGGATAHQALHRRDDVARLLRHQQARLVADQHAAGRGIGHDRGHHGAASLVMQRGGLALARDRYHGIGRAEIDADRERSLAGMRQRRFTRLVETPLRPARRF